MSRVWASFGLEPLRLARGVGAEGAEPDALLLLLAAVDGTGPDRGVQWVADVDVAPWSRVGRLHLLVHWAHIARVECCVNSFLIHNLVLHIVFFLIVVVLARSWILVVRLLGEWSVSLILPPVSALRLGHEALRIIADKLTIRVGLLVADNLCFD